MAQSERACYVAEAVAIMEALAVEASVLALGCVSVALEMVVLMSRVLLLPEMG